MAASLKDFAEKMHTWPDLDYASFEEWRDSILKNSKNFSHLLKDVDEKNEFYEPFCKMLNEHDAPLGQWKEWAEEKEKIRSAYVHRDKELRIKRKKLQNETFEWLRQNIDDLWD